MSRRSAPYSAGLRYMIDIFLTTGHPVSLAQLMLAIMAAIHPADAFKAGIAHRRRLAKRYGPENLNRIDTTFNHTLLALGERRIAWNVIERMKKNGRINITDPVNNVRLVTLGVPPTVGSTIKREQTWDEVLRGLEET